MAVPWWAMVLLVIGVLGGLPAIVFALMVGWEQLAERRYSRSLEARAERLAVSVHGVQPEFPRDKPGPGLRA